MELPDFHIPHRDKIEWMIETAGWAFEPVAPVADAIPPRPGYGYTIGLESLVRFPEIAIFGLTPVAAQGLVSMVVSLLVGGTEIPIGPELLGVLDNDLRCCFAPIDAATVQDWFPVAVAWNGGSPVDMVQLLYPDRDGVLPYERDFDERMRYAQPVIGVVGE